MKTKMTIKSKILVIGLALMTGACGMPTARDVAIAAYNQCIETCGADFPGILVLEENGINRCMCRAEYDELAAPTPPHPQPLPPHCYKCKIKKACKKALL